jgi:Tol biopolymer transport system component
MPLTRWILAAMLVATGLCAALISAAKGAAALLPSSGEIAFMSYQEINPDIFLMDIDQGLIHNLTHHDAYDGAPAWSPDGRWLAFISDREVGAQVYVMDANGASIRRLTDNRGSYGAPRWSADGTRLVFPAFHLGQNVLSTVNLDGTGLEQVTSETVYAGEVMVDLGIEVGGLSRVLSPDRSRLMFVSYRDTQWGIYLSNPDRSNDHLLAYVGDFAEPPVWSWDGRRIAYISFWRSTSDLFVIDVPSNVSTERTLPQRLTNSRAIDSSPSWRPS